MWLEQVVHHDDVARYELGDEDLLDIGFEGSPVDRSVEDEGRNHTAGAKAGDEGRRLPMAMWNANPQALPARGSSVAARHVGRSPSLVDENEPRRVEVELPFEPGLALLQDVGTILDEREDQPGMRLDAARAGRSPPSDPPPLNWSTLRYVFGHEKEDRNAEKAPQA